MYRRFRLIGVIAFFVMEYSYMLGSGFDVSGEHVAFSREEPFCGHVIIAHEICQPFLLYACSCLSQIVEVSVVFSVLIGEGLHSAHAFLLLDGIKSLKEAFCNIQADLRFVHSPIIV